MHKGMVTAAVVGPCIAVALLLGANQTRVLAKPFAQPGQKSASEALTDLSELFDRFGETDRNGLWLVMGDEKIAAVRKVVESNEALQEKLGDGSYLQSEDCVLWLSKSFDNQATLYKVPLSKIKTPIETFAKCDDECDGTLYVKTEDNEKAIVTTVLNKEPVAFVSVSNENYVYPSPSSLRRANQAAADLSILIRSCKVQN